jgi:hypothetical protein
VHLRKIVHKRALCYRPAHALPARHSGEDPIDKSDSRTDSWHKTADVSEEGDNSNLGINEIEGEKHRYYWQII